MANELKYIVRGSVDDLCEGIDSIQGLINQLDGINGLIEVQLISINSRGKTTVLLRKGIRTIEDALGVDAEEQFSDLSHAKRLVLEYMNLEFVQYPKREVTSEYE